MILIENLTTVLRMLYDTVPTCRRLTWPAGLALSKIVDCIINVYHQWNKPRFSHLGCFLLRHFAHCLQWWRHATCSRWHPSNLANLHHGRWIFDVKNKRCWKDFSPLSPKSHFIIAFCIAFSMRSAIQWEQARDPFGPWPTGWEALMSRNHICNFPHRGYETRRKERMCRGCWFDSKYYCVDAVLCSEDKADFAHHCFCITGQTEFSIIPGLSLFVTGE